MLTLAFSHLENLQEIHFDNGDYEHTERVNRDALNAAWSNPQVFPHPRYNQCPAQWSNSDLYEGVVQAV